MHDDNYNRYFVESLKKRLSLHGYTGVELSKITINGEKLCTKQHLSRVLNYKQEAGKKFRSKFADWLGVSVHDMVSEGYRLVSEEQDDSNNTHLKSPRRRATDVPLSALSTDELSSQIALYASDLHRNCMEISSELQRRVTEDRKANRELILCRDAVNQAPAGMVVIRIDDQTIVFRNQAHIGFEGKDLLGSNYTVSQIIDQEIVDQTAKLRKSVKKIVETPSREILSIMSWPILDSNGTSPHIGITIRDITTKYHESGIAKTTANRYIAALAKIGQNIYIFDETTRLVYTNATREGGLLYDASEEDLQTFHSVLIFLKKHVSLSEWEKSVAILQTAFSKQEPAQYQTELLSGETLISEINPILEGGVFRGIAVFSHVIGKDLAIKPFSIAE